MVPVNSWILITHLILPVIGLVARWISDQVKPNKPNKAIPFFLFELLGNQSLPRWM